MNTDPIADLLTRLRNACMARKPRVELPTSRIKKQIVEILKAEGFVDELREVAGKVEGTKVLEIKLRYDDGNQPVMQNVQRLSSPGMRRYMHADKIPTIRNGQGLVILTTSKGVMTDRECRKQGIGGEAICAVW